MTFAEKLDLLMNKAGANNAEIAALAGFDRTNVSRARNGQRLPSPTSSTAARLSYGLYLYYDKTNRLKELCALIGAEADDSADQIVQQITAWLFEGVEASPKARAAAKPAAGPKNSHPEKLTFARRLDALMKLAGLSNIRLSQLLHTDASLISRFRNGVRTPHNNPEMTESLSAILLERTKRMGRLSELASLLMIPQDELDADDVALYLTQAAEGADDSIQMAENLLESFDSYRPSPSMVLPSPGEIVPEAVLRAAKSVYYGTDGLREAVLRFLGNAALEKVPLLLLYSDEPQGWLTDDPTFRLTWAALMSACVKNGAHIQIIHNIDREQAEMDQAIRSWLPLYMSGMIESYYSTRKRNPRFSHTIFLCPDHFCIEAFHPIGTESRGIYHYYTDAETLKHCDEGYASLLEASRPLLTVPGTILYEGDSDITFLQGGLSVATMPEELVRKYHDEAFYEEWKTLNEAFHRQIEKHLVNECIPLTDDESLFSGTCRVERISGRGELFYTPAQYAMHIRNILRLSETCPHYRIYPLPETPFPNMRLLITGDAANIIHAQRPELTLGVRHPLLCRAFWNFAESLMAQHRMDRNSLRRMLEERYL